MKRQRCGKTHGRAQRRQSPLHRQQHFDACRASPNYRNFFKSSLGFEAMCQCISNEMASMLYEHGNDMVRAILSRRRDDNKALADLIIESSYYKRDRAKKTSTYLNKFAYK